MAEKRDEWMEKSLVPMWVDLKDDQLVTKKAERMVDKSAD